MNLFTSMKVFADFIEIESSMGYNDITDNLHEDTKDAM